MGLAQPLCFSTRTPWLGKGCGYEPQGKPATADGALRYFYEANG